MSNSKNTLKRMLDDFYPYAKDYLEFDKDASINFASDKSNAENPLGKTAYYDPANHSVTVYTNGRHPKDIMRSVSHELVHHTQNCRGDLNMSEHSGVGYAQNDEHLRNMEREAYEKGNLCFRDWEDGIKSNLQPGTIYEQKAHRSKNSMNNFKSLKENFNSFLQQESEASSYKAGDKVTVADGSSSGTVVEVMAGGEVVLELEDGSIIKVMSNELELSGGDAPMQEAEGKVQEYGDHEAQSQGGMTSSSQSSDPEMDQVVDIIKTVTEQGMGLHDFKQALEAESFDVQATSQHVMVNTSNGTMAIASVNNVELEGDEEIIKSPDGSSYAVGWIKRDFPESHMDLYDMDEGFRDSDEEKETRGEKAAQPSGEDQGIYDLHYTEAVKTDGRSPSDIELVDKIAELMTSDPEFRILQPFVDKFVRYSQSGGAVESSLEAALPDWVAGRHIFAIMKKAQGGQVDEGFRDSDEEKEMTSKMSNKEFSDYHTRDKHLAPDLKGDMGPLDGMEGPFQFRSGAVLYYDNKAGKYYDRGKDMYIDNEEASKLTMERNQMKLKSDLREKVKASVTSKLKEMYDDDDMFGDEDPYMAGLEAEFPWMADKKKKKGAPMGDDEAAMAAAAADAAAAGEFEVAPEEEEEVPSVTMRESNFAEYGAIDAQDGNPPSKIGQGDEAYMEAYNAVLVARGEEPLPVVQPDQAYLDALQSGSMKPADHSYNMEEGEEEVSHETTLRDRVMAKVQETLAEKAETTEEHDDDPALKGDQDELPDALQKNIIDKADGDDEKKEEALVKEEAEEEEVEEEVEESVTPTAEDFFRQLRNESRVVGRPEWSQESRTKRTSVLNERLMKAWFDK
jgi:hypothetical protein